MSELRLSPVDRLGFDFVPGVDDADRPLPFGDSPDAWRPLRPDEIGTLESGGSRADDWANILVKDGFSPAQVEDCRFYGPVRIGTLHPAFLEFHDLRLSVGLRSCTVVSCDIGDDVALHNVGYMAHMTIEPRCVVFNVHEMITTNHAKFGNGLVMDGEEEEVRIWLELVNENGGRRVLPFDGMLPADAWIWSKYRDDAALMDRFVEMTGRVRSSRRGTYGRVGSGSVIKDCRILKDVVVGESAYIKGCNKLKNLTINSDAERPTQLGEGCELVNGIVGYGCRVFYGVKAVRFVLNDHSALKYGARLINAVLGSNSTISCCEVLNCLIFGAHEQHHNSSFLCASVLKGQTNMASAATVGSNHNSRSSDGEIVADRGFWPGLSVSLKHDSRFAAFCLIAKGAYPAELNIRLPFCLVSNSESDGELRLMPGYWFRYNMYALARNSAKTAARDQRVIRHQELEFDWLAPDTVEQMVDGRRILEAWAEESPALKDGSYGSGRELLAAEEAPELLATRSVPVENSRRPTRILHAGRAWRDYGRMIRYWCLRELADAGPEAVEEALSGSPRSEPASAVTEGKSPAWENIGGQLITRDDLEGLKDRVRSGAIADWDGMHTAYRDVGSRYAERKASWARVWLAETAEGMDVPMLLNEAEETARFIDDGIRESRRKDYSNPFRNITYDSETERDAVIGSFEENSFIKDARKALSRELDWIRGLRSKT